MPRYSFELNDGEYPSSNEVWFTDREHALDHADTVARELMSGRELRCRSWRLDVYENGMLVHEIPFASIDPTLDHLDQSLRMTIEQSCDTLRSYKEAASAARATARETRALVARSRGKPYLATERGEPTIRPPGEANQPRNLRR